MHNSRMWDENRGSVKYTLPVSSFRKSPMKQETKHFMYRSWLSRVLLRLFNRSEKSGRPRTGHLKGKIHPSTEVYWAIFVIQNIDWYKVSINKKVKQWTSIHLLTRHQMRLLEIGPTKYRQSHWTFYGEIKSRWVLFKCDDWSCWLTGWRSTGCFPVLFNHFRFEFLQIIWLVNSFQKQDRKKEREKLHDNHTSSLHFQGRTQIIFSVMPSKAHAFSVTACACMVSNGTGKLVCSYHQLQGTAFCHQKLSSDQSSADSIAYS